MRRYTIVFLTIWVTATLAWVNVRQSSRQLSILFALEDDYQVSDAQALLACRAYLTKKNSTRWTQAARRQLRSKQALKHMAEARRNSEGTGFFWEDPSELLYLGTITDSELTEEGNANSVADQDEVDVEEEEEAIWETITPFGHMQRIEVQEENDDGGREGMIWEQDIEGDSLSSTLLPSEPSDRYRRQSKSSRELWNDPDFRQRWYESRWKGRTKSSEAKARERTEERLQAMDLESFLADQALADMTEQEIEGAISMYVQSSRRRSQSRRRTMRADGDESEKVSPFFLGTNEETLKELQRKRSKRAAKAYQTRLNNQTEKQQKRRKRVTPPAPASSGSSTKTSPAHTALNRILADLDKESVPSRQDVCAFLEPTKLAGRKELLRRILAECFDLRGRCVPVDDGYEFVTKSTIQQLGDFVVTKLEETEGGR